MTRKLILGTALALMLGTATTNLTPAHAAKGDAKVGKGKKGAKKERPMPAITADMLGKVLGKTLTDEQATAVKDANTAYADSIAKVAGMTVDELKAKLAEYRKANPGGKGGAGGAGKKAAP